jgi:hypothetical protein
MTIVLTFVFVAMVFTVLVWAFADGVVNSAADQAARAGSRIDVDSVPVCEARARQALANMLPGATANVSCSESDGVVTSTVQIALSGGVPPFSSTTLTGRGTARKESVPA